MIKVLPSARFSESGYLCMTAGAGNIRICRDYGRPFVRWLRAAGAKAVDVAIRSPEVQPGPDIIRLWLAEEFGSAAG